MDWKRLGLVLLALALFGAAKLSFEEQLTKDFRQSNFFRSQLNLDVRAQTTQMGFIAALSGVRAPVADIIWAKTYDAFAETNWGKLKVLIDAATTLQPRATLFWDNASWHMAWNASVASLRDESQPREVLRIKHSREYMELGEDYLLRGIAFNPDRAKLFESIAMLYAQRLKDPCKSAWAYFEAAKRPDAMSFDYRFGVYQLAQCPGHEAETLKLLQDLYHQGPQERTVTSLRLLDQFQKKLNVPAAEQIDITEDLKKATPHAPPKAP